MSIAPPMPSCGPMVSVVIPAYCAAQYAASAVSSVIKQTFTDKEIILVNDGSPDSPALEESLAPYREQLVYIKQDNRGPSAARNAGIKAARGRFIAFLDADDYWNPEYLTEQMRVLQSDPSMDMVYADALIIGESARAGMTFMQAAPSRGKSDFQGILTGRCAVILSGAVVRRESIVAAGMFDERLRCSEDYDLWLRLARRGAHITYQQKVLFFRRELLTGLCADSIKLFRAQVRVLAKVLREFELTEFEQVEAERQLVHVRAALSLELGRAALSRGEYHEAAESIDRANTVLESRKLKFVLLSLRYWPRLLRMADRLRDRKPRVTRPPSFPSYIERTVRTYPTES